MKLTLPLPPNRANARWHWRTEKRKKDAYYEGCLARYGKLPPVTFFKATITARLYVHQLMDLDNLTARLKWPLDWLVWRGYIADDSPKVLVWTGEAQQLIDRKNQRIEIELEGIIEETPEAA